MKAGSKVRSGGSRWGGPKVHVVRSIEPLLKRPVTVCGSTISNAKTTTDPVTCKRCANKEIR